MNTKGIKRQLSRIMFCILIFIFACSTVYAEPLSVAIGTYAFVEPLIALVQFVGEQHEAASGSLHVQFMCEAQLDIIAAMREEARMNTERDDVRTVQAKLDELDRLRAETENTQSNMGGQLDDMQRKSLIDYIKNTLMGEAVGAAAKGISAAAVKIGAAAEAAKPAIEDAVTVAVSVCQKAGNLIDKLSPGPGLQYYQPPTQPIVNPYDVHKPRQTIDPTRSEAGEERGRGHDEGGIPDQPITVPMMPTDPFLKMVNNPNISPQEKLRACDAYDNYRSFVQGLGNTALAQGFHGARLVDTRDIRIALQAQVARSIPLPPGGVIPTDPSQIPGYTRGTGMMSHEDFFRMINDPTVSIMTKLRACDAYGNFQNFVRALSNTWGFRGRQNLTKFVDPDKIRQDLIGQLYGIGPAGKGKQEEKEARRSRRISGHGRITRGRGRTGDACGRH